MTHTDLYWELRDRGYTDPEAHRVTEEPELIEEVMT